MVSSGPRAAILLEQEGEVTMSIHHTPAPHHEVARSQIRQTKTTVVRDHREASRPQARPAVRYDQREHRDRDDRSERQRPIIEHRVIERPIVRPVVRPVYVQPTAYWTPSAAYTVAPQPIDLMGPTALASDQLSLDVNLGASTALELDAAGGGSTYVSQVVLVDAYGGSQALAVNQTLSPQNPSIQLPLSNGSSIVRVIVDGHSDWGGQLAMRAL
jgi:hypothetical protein